MALNRLTNGGFARWLHFINANNSKRSDRVAVFFLQKGEKGRYIFSVINTFKLCGFDILLAPNREFYRSCDGFYIYDIFKFLKIGRYNKSASTYTLRYAVVDSLITSKESVFDKVLSISYNQLDKNINYHLAFPFHPFIFIQNNFTSIMEVDKYLFEVRANAKRTVTIIFGGQLSAGTHLKLNLLFRNFINRVHLFKLIFEKFGGRVARSLEAQQTEGKPILIVDRNQNELKPSEWLTFLSLGNFFIAAPGFEMPMCHNIIEGMATGLIPILQYDQFFHPPLQNNINCLAFRNSDELEQCIEKALNMESDDIDMFRANVLDYYDQHLSPASFVKKIQDSSEENIVFSVIAGAQSFASAIQ